MSVKKKKKSPREAYILRTEQGPEWSLEEPHRSEWIWTVRKKKKGEKSVKNFRKHSHTVLRMQL